MTVALTSPIPLVDADLVTDTSFALSEVVASELAALRRSRELLIPAPFEITARLSGVYATAPLDDILEIQKILNRRRIAAADYKHGLIRVEGEFDGQPWTLTSMHRRW